MGALPSKRSALLSVESIDNGDFDGQPASVLSTSPSPAFELRYVNCVLSGCENSGWTLNSTWEMMASLIPLWVGIVSGSVDGEVLFWSAGCVSTGLEIWRKAR